jgi:diguanylate cyclase (GGDEF)-like protein
VAAQVLAEARRSPTGIRLRWGAVACLAVYLSALLLGPHEHRIWRELSLQVLTLSMIAGYVWYLVATERRSRGWRALMAGWVTFFDLGNILTNAHSGPILPDWANLDSMVLYVWSYPCAIVGILLRQRGRWRGRDPGAVLDAMISTLAIAAFFTAFVVPRALIAAGGSGIPLALVLAFPTCDLTVLGVTVATTALGHVETRRLSGWLILAIVLFGAADWQYAVGAAAGTWRTGTPIDGVWVIGCAIVGLLACEQPDPDPAAGHHDRAWALAGVAVPMLSAFSAVVLLAVGTRVRMPLAGVVLAVTAVTAVLLRLGLAYAQLRAFAETSRMARIDELTGLPNRRALLERLAEVGSRLPAAPFAVTLIDLDGFKEVNDQLGHAAGDELLRLVAGRLRSAMPAAGTLGRLGGDEFAAVLPDAGTARAVARAMVAVSEPPVVIAGHDVTASLSIGLAVALGPDPPGPAEVLRRADVAMYVAKRAGGARAHVYRDRDDHAGPAGPAASAAEDGPAEDGPAAGGAGRAAERRVLRQTGPPRSRVRPW